MHFKVESTIDAGDPEVKKETSVNAIDVQNNSATSQLIMYHSDWRRLNAAVAWILKVKRALLEMSNKRKQLLLDAPADLNYIEQEMLKARGSVGQSLSTGKSCYPVLPKGEISQ